MGATGCRADRRICGGAARWKFNPAGQDWGLAPINPSTIAHNDFSAVRRLMRAAMRHAGAIRLDHVMGLRAHLYDFRTA